MKDFVIFDKVLNLNWVRRLCSNQDALWQYIPPFYSSSIMTVSFLAWANTSRLVFIKILFPIGKKLLQILLEAMLKSLIRSSRTIGC